MKMKLFFVALTFIFSVSMFTSCGNKKNANDATAQTEQLEEKCCEGHGETADGAKECCGNTECESAKKEGCCKAEKAETDGCCKEEKSE